MELFKSKKSKQPCKNNCLQATKHQLVYFQTNNYSKENKYGEILFKRKLFLSKVAGVKKYDHNYNLLSYTRVHSLHNIQRLLTAISPN